MGTVRYKEDPGHGGVFQEYYTEVPVFQLQVL